MSVRASLIARFCLAAVAGLAAAGPAAAWDVSWNPWPSEPRGLNGRTYTTSRVPAGPRADDLIRLGPGLALSRHPQFNNQLPACDDAGALNKIASAFAQKESRFWNSSLEIAGFDRLRLIATNPWGQNNIPRRFCTGQVRLSDGRVRPVSYAILEDQGIIGLGYGVEWCVHGLDRGRSFDPACRMARP